MNDMEDNVCNTLDNGLHQLYDGLDQNETEKIRAFIIKSNTLLLLVSSSEFIDKMLKQMFGDKTGHKK